MLFEKENTEEKIIRATFKILQEEGIQKTTTKKIAAEADVNEVTIFRKFENKNNLINATKDFYMKILIEKIEEIFDYEEEESIQDFLKRGFYGILNLSPDEFSIVKVAMQETENAPDRKKLLAEITDVIIRKFEEFFVHKAESGEIRDINPRSIALMCYCVTFQSIILYQIYEDSDKIDGYDYSKDYEDIFFNGIRPQ